MCIWVKKMRRQALNVFRMKLLGATVIPVASGSKTLKDATNEAFRIDGVGSAHTLYLGVDCWPSSVSNDGEGFPDDNRERGQEANIGKGT